MLNNEEKKRGGRRKEEAGEVEGGLDTGWIEVIEVEANGVPLSS